jgi:hypothetical protein
MEKIKITRYSQGEYIVDIEKMGEMWGFTRYEIIFYYLGKYEMDLKFIEMTSVETTEKSVVIDYAKKRLTELNQK